MERNELDRFLDEALGRYSCVDPRPALEQRVLSRVRAEAAAPRFGFLRWALPAVALACLLAGIAFRSYRAPVSTPPNIRETAASTPQPALAPVETARPLPKLRRNAPVGARRAGLPKQAVFPIPTRLTNEERALVALARSSPKLALEAFREAPQQEIRLIRIEEIKIPPLQIGDGAQ
ncbi:MAG TPA: hypothetical protein VFA33_13885 [Bryobacteraceae bacterium]|nr:hypothetical protein [Bryobacteraceae bacterium]